MLKILVDWNNDCTKKYIEKLIVNHIAQEANKDECNKEIWEDINKGYCS